METIINKNDLGAVALGLFSEYLQFKDRDVTDSNRSRWAVSEFWHAFLQDVENVHLCMIYPEAKILRSKQWFTDNMTRLFACLALYSELSEQDFTLQIKSFIDEGKKRIKQSHKQEIYQQVKIDRLLKEDMINIDNYMSLSY